MVGLCLPSSSAGLAGGGTVAALFHSHLIGVRGGRGLTSCRGRVLPRQRLTPRFDTGWLNTP